MSKELSLIADFSNQTLVRQATKLYQLGIELEAERQKLNEYVNLYGMSGPIVEGQSARFDELHSMFIKLEMAHIEASKNQSLCPNHHQPPGQFPRLFHTRHLKQSRCDIGQSAALSNPFCLVSGD